MHKTFQSIGLQQIALVLQGESQAKGSPLHSWLARLIAPVRQLHLGCSVEFSESVVSDSFIYVESSQGFFYTLIHDSRYDQHDSFRPTFARL